MDWIKWAKKYEGTLRGVDQELGGFVDFFVRVNGLLQWKYIIGFILMDNII